MYLVDTNIWLEALLGQEKERQVQEFLSQTDSSDLNISDFTVFSIGIILGRLEELDVLDRFYRDVIYDSNVTTIRLLPPEILRVIKIQKKYGLDYDDSYQYVSAVEHDLQMISFDDDFDDTDLDRIIPAKVLSK